MTIQMELGALGKIKAVAPKNFTACTDFALGLKSDPSQAETLRICAGAIGVVANTGNLPKYRPEKDDPMSYGAKMVDRLMGFRMEVGDIFVEGNKALDILLDKAGIKVKVEEEAIDKVNFTSEMEIEDGQTTEPS